MAKIIKLGPLLLPAPSDSIGETAGDTLDAVGAVLTPGDRRPRPLKLKVAVHGEDSDTDPTVTGLRLRRQLRQLIDNARWRSHGFFLWFEPDPDLDAWVQIGGVDIDETDAGVTFGEFDADLSDVYVVGRPGTHRPGRRAVILDRRLSTVPRDTRRTLYSTDFAAQALPAEPLYLPGDVIGLASSANRAVAAVDGPIARGKRAFKTAPALDGEVITYLPDPAVWPGRTGYQDLNDFCAVRAWDLTAATTYPPDPDAYFDNSDTDPTAYGWERVFGDVVGANRPLAVENGLCRLIWLGPAATQGLAVEFYDGSALGVAYKNSGDYRRLTRVLHALNVTEQRVVELTPERAVLEWRAGPKALRAILQRGWWGPRLESYDDAGGQAVIEVAGAYGEAGVAGAAQTPSWVDRIDLPVTDFSPAIENLVVQPSAEVTISKYVVTNGTPSMQTETAAAGTRTLRVVPTAAGDVSIFLPGDAPTGGAGPVNRLRLPNPTRPLHVTTSIKNGGGGTRDVQIIAVYRNAVGAHIGSDPVVAFTTLADAGSPAFRTYGPFNMGTPPAGAVSVEVYVWWIGAVTSRNITLDAVQVVNPAGAGTVPPPYGDPSTAPNRWRWTGTAHDSTSVYVKAAAAYYLAARGTNDMTRDNNVTVVTAPGQRFYRTSKPVVVVDLSPPSGPAAAELASRSLVDAQGVPVLVGRR